MHAVMIGINSVYLPIFGERRVGTNGEESPDFAGISDLDRQGCHGGVLRAVVRTLQEAGSQVR